MKKIQSPLLFIIIALLVALTVLLFVLRTVPEPQSGPSNLTVADNQATVIPRGWETFVDQEKRFVFSHDPVMKAAEAREPYFLLATPEIMLMTDQASYHPMNYIQDSWLAVSSQAEQGKCFEAVNGGQTPFANETSINGVTFKVASFTDAGAGNRYETTLYRTVREQTCYEIATTLHYASDWTNVDQAAMDQSQSEARDLLAKSVGSFLFGK